MRGLMANILSRNFSNLVRCLCRRILCVFLKTSWVPHRRRETSDRIQASGSARGVVLGVTQGRRRDAVTSPRPAGDCSHPARRGAERQPEACPPTPPCSPETWEAGPSCFLPSSCLFVHLVVLGLHCERGSSPAPLASPLHITGAASTGFSGVAHGLSCLSRAGSSRIRAQNRVSFIGRQADSLPPSHQGSSPTPGALSAGPASSLRGRSQGTAARPSRLRGAYESPWALSWPWRPCTPPVLFPAPPSMPTLPPPDSRTKSKSNQVLPCLRSPSTPPQLWPLPHRLAFIYWRIVNSQCSLSVKYTRKWFGYIYTYIFS